MNRRQLLVQALKVLAAPASEQLTYLRDAGVPNNLDELCLEFDAIGAAVDDMLRCRELSGGEVAAVKRITAIMGQLDAKDQKIWTAEALAQSPKWEYLRKAAGQVCEEIG